MNPALIGIGIFLGILLGVGVAFLLILFKNNLIKKNALKKIEEQRLKFTLNGKPLDLVGKIEKETEKKEEQKVRVVAHRRRPTTSIKIRGRTSSKKIRR